LIQYVGVVKSSENENLRVNFKIPKIED